jgi:hypothetical protein
MTANRVELAVREGWLKRKQVQNNIRQEKYKGKGKQIK